MSTSNENIFDISEKLIQMAREVAGGRITYLSEMLGLNKTYLSNVISNGSNASKRRGLPKHCDSKIIELGYNPAWVRYGIGEKLISKTDKALITEPLTTYNPEIKNITLQLYLIPVIGRIPAGFPDMREAEIVDTIRLTEPMNNAFALLVDGDSMSPRIKSGNYVIFQTDVKINHGDIVVARNEFGESFLKKFVEKDGEKWLISENPSYPNFKMNHSYTIIGKVIERIEREKIR